MCRYTAGYSHDYKVTVNLFSTAPRGGNMQDKMKLMELFNGYTCVQYVEFEYNANVNTGMMNNRLHKQ